MTLVSRIHLVAKSPIRDALIADVQFRTPLFPAFTYWPFRGVQRAVRIYRDDERLAGTLALAAGIHSVFRKQKLIS